MKNLFKPYGRRGEHRMHHSSMMREYARRRKPYSYGFGSIPNWYTLKEKKRYVRVSRRKHILLITKT